VSEKSLAVRLLRAHRDEIARAIVAQVDRHAPSMLQVDRRARSQSIAALAEAVAEALDGGSAAHATTLMKNSARLRIAGGVTREDLLASQHMYLPAIRRVFLQHHGNLREALAAFDVVEEAALPMIVALAKVILQFDPAMLEEEPTNPAVKARRGKKPLEHPFQSGEGE
jgi:hypothetical protein